jgi:hypothetical protein
MKIRYEAFSPADDGERIASGEFELPDDAGQAATLGALENAVENEGLAESGSQVRVAALVDGEPSISHTWDHA